MPRTVTITISDLVAHKLELMEMNPTKVCNAMLEWYLSDYDKDIGLIFMMEHTTERIRIMKNEIATLENKKTLVKRLEAELKVLKDTYEDSSGKIEIQYLISYLNKRIIAYHYDIKVIQEKQADVIAKIKEKNPRFSLRKHIDKVRMIREETLI